jgi:hypothetical protein
MLSIVMRPIQLICLPNLFLRARKLWENYIETCHRHGSLVGYTWDQLRVGQHFYLPYFLVHNIGAAAWWATPGTS